VPQAGAAGRAAASPGREAAAPPAGAGPAASAAAGQAGAPPVAVEAGTIRLTVLPWAEVWVDGVKRGVTPPLKSLALPAGAHRVELRNPSAEPVLRRIEVQAGQSVEITHRFGGAP
jgi:non-specific serine/threonine protein kinase